ncbi:hypothetical protein ACFC1R_06125 [Kitasatospora sp. NPDC056138]|uniref:hypothetical protein n=1 Tax=Kitasatospora sp. NPDC056138 TaxID=3345724 RepID=UPI0035E08809
MKAFPRLLATAVAAGTMILAAAIPASATPAQSNYSGDSYAYSSPAAAKQAAVNNALESAAAAGFSAGQCRTLGVPQAYPDNLSAARTALRAAAPQQLPPGTVWDGSAQVQCITQPVAGTVALERYNGPEHQSATGSAPAGYYLEGNLGWLYTSQVSGTHALYQCKAWNSTDTFTSAAGNCEGQQYLGQLGFINDAPPAGLASRVVRRCTVNGEHFDSNDYNCEGQVAEGILGYSLN